MNNYKSPIVVKSFAFSTRCIKLYQYLQNKKEFTISNQVLRSGTSVGANIQEALSAYSRSDFVHKYSIALKEARETLYWIEQLKATDYLPKNLADSLISDNETIIKLLYVAIKTAKSNTTTKN